MMPLSVFIEVRRVFGLSAVKDISWVFMDYGLPQNAHLVPVAKARIAAFSECALRVKVVNEQPQVTFFEMSGDSEITFSLDDVWPVPGEGTGLFAGVEGVFVIRCLVEPSTLSELFFDIRLSTSWFAEVIHWFFGFKKYTYFAYLYSTKLGMCDFPSSREKHAGGEF